MESSIASAVVLPEPQESPPPSASPPNRLKRRQSSISQQDGKRRRLSTDEQNGVRGDSTADTATAQEVDRRRSSVKVDVKERTRGKRLFGAVLGALSQGSSSTAQRRRAEIEKKQQAKLKMQEQENDQRKQDRLDKLMAKRRKEQRIVDEQSMRIRHSNLLDMAHFLYTRTEPRLYYKPWELTPEEEDRIDEQIADAQATIDKELEDVEAQKVGEQDEETAGNDGMEHDRNAVHHRTSVGIQHEENDAREMNGVTNDREPALPSSPKNQETKDDHAEKTSVEIAVNGAEATLDETEADAASEDAPMEEGGKEGMDENGEEVFEAAEDTVIY